MTPQYATYLILVSLFNNSPFNTQLNIYSDDCIIYFEWRSIKNETYSIDILNDGSIICRYGELIIDEMELLFNCVNQSYINYGSDKSKAWRYVATMTN